MKSQKALFSLPEDIHYLNCAYKAPMLKAAEEAAIKSLHRERNPIEISENDFFDEAVETRKLFGELVNCKAENVALIPSTSYGFASVLNNIKPKLNGKAITVKDEFPSAYFSVKRWCYENNNELEIIAPKPHTSKIGKEWNEALLNAIDNNTSLVIISGIHWITGTKFDLKQIGEKCKNVGAKFLVDGTQMIGAVPCNLVDLNIDALVCASYKWLFGPYSLAVAYIGNAFANGKPLEESFMNRSNARNFAALADYDPEYQAHAARYNVGESSNFVLMPILKAGLNQVLEWKPENIQSYCKDLSSKLLDYLSEMGLEIEDIDCYSPHLISLRIGHIIDTNELKTSLKKARVYTSSRGEYLRIAINVFNTKEDIDVLIEVLDNIKKRTTLSI